MDQERIAWSRVNNVESWRRIVCGSDLSEIIEFDGILVTNCGLPMPIFNVAFVTRPLGSPEKSIERTLSYLEGTGLPSMVTFTPEIAPEAEDILIERKYKRTRRWPGMVLHPIRTLPQTPGELEIRPVVDDVALREFQTTVEGGFGMPFKLPRHLASPRLRDHPAVSMFVGYVDDAPASTSCLITTGPVAGVYFVATLEAFRGRGFGAAMTAHAVRTGRARGCDMATLRASGMGLPVYERMGFEVTDDYRSYQVPRRE